MKRTVSLLLVLVLLAGLFPTALAASAPVTSNNLNDHFYINAGRFYHPIYSNLAWENGNYVRAEAIGNDLVVETYDQDFNFVSGKTIPLELPVFGGVRMDTDYNFVVVGQDNLNEDDSVEVFRIIRYTKDWQKVDHASLFGANTYIPFDAGSLRFDRSGDILYIRTAHEMYDSGDGLHHQANVMISVRISDMTVTDELTRVLNRNYGYISHSFNQFVRVDGDTLLAVDHGDALPRSVVLIKYGRKAGEEQFYGRVSYVNALPIADSTYHYNDTGVSVGGFECSSTDYLIAGSAYDMSETVDLMYAHRNIFVTATPKDNFTDEGTVLHWLTNYSESDGVEVSPPHLLKVSADRFLLTWTEDGTLKYCFLNGKGQLDGSVKTMAGSLSDCVPIKAGRYAVWYVTKSSAPQFYQIELEACTHSYTSKVTAPTCTERGYTTHTCSECGDSYVDSYTAALGHSYGSWYTVQAPTCSAPGTQRRDCSRCDAYETGSLAPVDHDYRSTITAPTCTERGYTTHTCLSCGESYVDTYVPALGHDHAAVVTAPTCTEQGYTTHTCTRCADRYIDSYTAALGHEWDAGVVITEPTEEESGLRRHTCQRCGITEDRVIPALGHTHRYDSVVTAPTCTQQGYTSHTCTCGDSYVDSYVPALGHAHDAVVTAATCTEPGFTTHTCERCGDRYLDGHTAALGHEYLNYKCIRCSVLQPTPFGDVEYGSYYHIPVLWAVENNITSGATTTQFDPHGIANRAQAVTFLWRVAGQPDPTSNANPFTDVKEGEYYYKAVLWAVEKGITYGVSSTKFAPYEQCSRSQVISFLWRAKGEPAAAYSSTFTDVPSHEWYAIPISWAAKNGIAYGVSDTVFGVHQSCSRAQIVTFLYRTFAPK